LREDQRHPAGGLDQVRDVIAAAIGATDLLLNPVTRDSEQLESLAEVVNR
jgi:hypothetical protein